MSRPPNICGYCGKPGKSKEHLWGQWSEKYVPHITTRTTHSLLGNVHNLNPGDTKPGPMQRQGNLRSQQIKTVCQPCNNGWMRLLGESAEPHLARLAKGEWWKFSKDEAKVIASWLTMFTMSYEFKDLKTMASTQAERRFLMDNLEPPPTWAISIAQHELRGWREKVQHTGIGLHATYHQPVGEVRDRFRVVPNANFQVTVSTFGKLLFMTSLMRGDAEEFCAPYDPHFEAEQRGMRMLWPPYYGHNFPEPTIIPDNDIEIIANKTYLDISARVTDV